MPAAPLSVFEAREIALGAVRHLDPERVTVQEAAGRVLAQELKAASDVPPFPCSAMDGYAVKAGPPGRTLTVIGEARAGSPSERPVGDGEAIRVSTGAAIPAGTEGVVRQEDVERRDGKILVRSEISPGENIRAAGEDLQAGATVLYPGAVLGTAELGTAVNAGAGEVSVRRQPRVVVLCTGDELRAPGEPLGPGQIYNTNGPMLRLLAQRAGALVAACDQLPDDAEATRAGLAAGLERADVLIISGGVSVGPHDYVKPALEILGVKELFWRVALQPGGPTWFGERDGKLVFGLPGNPVSAVVTFTLFVRPALLAMQGFAPQRRLEAEGRLAVAVARNPKRLQAMRVRLERVDGTVLVTPNGPQGSHLISSLLGADALAFIPPGEGELPAGAQVALEELPA